MDDKHIGKRQGGITAEKGKRPTYTAFGTIAYATVYGVAEQQLKAREERDLIRKLQGYRPRHWQVERRVRQDLWVTADKGMQGDTMEQAIAMCRGLPGYRVVRVWSARGRGHH